MTPDFTVVTASYNYGRFIGDCLGSVAGQGGVTVEHLVFDGGSTDATAEVLSRFPGVSAVTGPDRGMCDAINQGFRAARGEWVMWLNADDRLLPGALAAVKEFAARHPEADVIYGCWNFIGEDGGFQRRMTLFPYLQDMMLYMGCYIGSTATFFRRRTVTAEGHLLNESFRYVMDGEYYARLGSLGKRFAYFPKVLADFRLHGENLSFRNHGARGVDDWLKLQKQFAESRAYRRAYGRTWFADENLNAILDSVLYLFFRALKPLLKRLYLLKLRHD
jgi:glycosyltransferase involved in cell wall biosynthesis